MVRVDDITPRNVESHPYDGMGRPRAARESDAVTSSAGTIGDSAGMSIYLPYGTTKVDTGYTPANDDFLNIVPNWDDFLATL